MNDPKTIDEATIADLQAQLATAKAERDVAQKAVDKFRSEARVSDAEIGGFQDRVRDLLLNLIKCPSEIIDGKGSDAGWEEFTLAEIGQGVAYVIDQRAASQKACAEMRRQIGAIKHAIESNQPIPWLTMCKRMEHALSTDCGEGFVPKAELDQLKELVGRLMDLIEGLRRRTPEPPKAITWENGVAILNYIQDEFLPQAIAAAKEHGFV